MSPVTMSSVSHLTPLSGSREPAPAIVRIVMLLSLATLAGAPAQASVTITDHATADRPSMLIVSDGATRQCIPLEQDDGSFENAYAWNFDDVQPPNLGAFTKHFQSPFPGPTLRLCEASFFFTTVPQFPQGPARYDAIIYSHDPATGTPGSEILRIADLSPGPVAIWPNSSEHVVDFAGATVPSEFWIAFWPQWVGAELEWFICADENGSEPPIVDHTIATATGGQWVPVKTPGLGLERCKNLGIRCRVEEERVQYPPAGVDTFDSEATIVIDIPSLGLSQTIEVSGPTTLRRGIPRQVGGLAEIETEILSLDLTGVSCLGPVTIRQNATRPSLGLVRQLVADQGYPAESFFDVFLEIDVNGTVVHNEDPLPLFADNQIYSLPPYDDEYVAPGPPIPVANRQGLEIGSIAGAIYVPRAPRDAFDSVLELDTDAFATIGAEGPVVLLRDAALWNPDLQLWETAIEIMAMDVRGTSGAGPVIVRESPARPSTGQVMCETYDGFPCESFFDVFFEIEFTDTGEKVCNQEPARMVATINGLPVGDPYVLTGPPVTLVDCVTMVPVGQLVAGVHTPGDPFPWHPFPPAGIDCFCATAILVIDLGQGPITIDTLTGLTRVERGPAVELPDGTREIPAAIAELDLGGLSELGPLGVFVNTSAPPSAGAIRQLERGPSFPAESFFDVYFMIEAPGLVLHNAEPVRLQSVINGIPPEEPYQAVSAVPLLDANQVPVGTLVDVIHDPGPPFTCDCAVSLDCRFGSTGLAEPGRAPRRVAAVRLYAGVPNPFAATTAISFDLKAGGPARLEIYDLAGRLVTTLVDRELDGQTRHTVTWDGSDRDRRAVPPGIYFIRLTAEGQNMTRKAILMR